MKQGNAFPWKKAEQPSESGTSKKLCAKCLSEFGRGKSHQCTKDTFKQNLSDIQSQTSSDDECVGATSQSPTASFEISSKSLAHIQSELNLSRNKTLKLGQEIRKATQNQVSIEPFLKDKLYNISHFLDEQFEVKTCDFFDNSGEQYERPVVYCKDIQRLIHVICTTRGIDHDNVFIKLSLDGGGGFVKVMISVFTIDDENVQPKTRNRKDTNTSSLRVQLFSFVNLNC